MVQDSLEISTKSEHLCTPLTLKSTLWYPAEMCIHIYQITCTTAYLHDENGKKLETNQILINIKMDK
jgi:hypothetical protein